MIRSVGGSMGTKAENIVARAYVRDRLVEIYRGEDDMFVVSCPELKGCHSQGESVREAIDNIGDAIDGVLELDDG